MPIINTSDKDVSVFNNQNVSEEEIMDGLVNGYFNHTDNSFNTQGFKPFGMFPCNDNYTYLYYSDRLIHVRTIELKGCLKKEIENIEDITDNFDYTPVETYKVSDKILERAKNLKI